MRTPKRTAALLAAGALLTALAGCASGGDSPQSGDEAGVLQVQAVANMMPQFEVVADAFEKANPGVTVELQSITNEQKISSNLQVLASSNPPDVGYVSTNTVVYSQLVKNDGLLPLDDVWSAADLENAYGPSVAASLSPAGAPNVVLIDKTLYGVVWYNKAIFEEAGIEVPADHQLATLDDLVQITDALRAQGKQPIAIGGKSGYQWGWVLDSLLPTSATPEELESYTSSFVPDSDIAARYSDPAFVDTLTRIKDMFDRGVFVDGGLGLDGDASAALFASQQAGMLLGGHFNVSALKENNKVDLDMGYLFLPPVNEGELTLPNVFGGDTLGVPVNADQPDLAKKFLEFIVSPEMQEEAFVANGQLPAITTLPEETLEERFEPLAVDLVQYSAEQGSAAGWTSVVPGELGQLFIDPKIQQMLSGGSTPEQIGEETDAQLEQVRSNS